MAHFKCKCGLRLSNGLCPNDIQIRVVKDETWQKAVCTNKDIVFVFMDYDIWKCPRCNRVYSFKKNNIDKMFAIEEVEMNILTQCLCGQQDFNTYIAYTDIEMDRYTSTADTAGQMPNPPRDLWSCNTCNRFFLKEAQSEIIQVYREQDYYAYDDIASADEEPRNVYLIPKGYTGWIEIHYRQASYPLIEINNNEYVFEIPDSGILRISNKEPHYEEDEYYYTDSNGRSTCELVSRHIIEDSGETLREKFLVGKEENKD
ncbi:ribosomal protein L37AE/L43A [Paenibacillus phyllosphaerae]|uniref:Ribosomal protein L37AE/L43A n=1 Tax=Paenibacillus phyllosphaerae TaxID=274593 RepID=A0A7W5FNS6_9BACL|nr:hypothetical protein [Paenibacillus phyllosphaerae]MBB3111314.1 ribosomal protein L37AE/L43A [Paenibacillus phyllosphaerae]